MQAYVQNLINKYKNKISKTTYKIQTNTQFQNNVAYTRKVGYLLLYNHLKKYIIWKLKYRLSQNSLKHFMITTSNLEKQARDRQAYLFCNCSFKDSHMTLFMEHMKPTQLVDDEKQPRYVGYWLLVPLIN